jgi:hypothetical protein
VADDSAKRGLGTTRFDIPRDPRAPVDHLDSGYEGDGPSEDFTIPPCGIADADMALLNLFDKQIGFTVRSVESANKDVQIKKPVVIFATGERFVLAKRLRPPRDRNKKLLLPAVIIRRTGLDQSDLTKRGLNPFAGNLILKRRLAPEDRDYQALINKLGFKHLQTYYGSSRDSGDFADSPEAQEGALLDPHLGNNVWEILTIPAPQFFLARYEVTFWTNFVQHMNYMIETYISSFLPGDRIHRLVTDKGYWFTASADESWTSADNFEDLAEAERLVRYTFQVSVRGYILAPQHPTNQVPVRRWISAPTVVFETKKHETEVVNAKHLQRLKSDDDPTTFELTDTLSSPESNQTPLGDDAYLFRKDFLDRKTGKVRRKYVKIVGSNEISGETIYRATDVQILEEFLKSRR